VSTAALAAVVMVLITAFGGRPAAASDTEAEILQAQIDAVLENSPDGVQISENEIAWDDGTMILTIPMEGEDGARGSDEEMSAYGSPDCPLYWTCLYEDRDFGGARVAFTECGFIHQLSKTRPYFRDKASSYHDNQTGGVRTTVYDWNDWVGWFELWKSSPAPTWSSFVGVDKQDRADGLRAC
jgi:hypothetical protein